jgi:DNA-binding winged helix-turn-helix (wHTH) protein
MCASPDTGLSSSGSQVFLKALQMSELKPAEGSRLRCRWCFQDCVFDEANWTLIVSGERVTIETKPLELLRVLLQNAGNLVTKDELLDRIWPNVIVVEGSLPTAVHKLRLALADEKRTTSIIETVPRVGYRLAVPVRVEEPASPPMRVFSTGTPAPVASLSPAETGVSRWRRPLPVLSMLSGAAIAVALGAFMFAPPENLHASKSTPVYTQQQARAALRRLDVRAIEDMLAAGWDPNKPFDDQGNGAINIVLDQCEWDHGHHQEEILLMIRTLTDEGAVIDRRNTWGDTPYSIAKTARFCGPDHPVTRYLRVMCTQGKKPLGDRCMATYELARGRHLTVRSFPQLSVAKI